MKNGRCHKIVLFSIILAATAMFYERPPATAGQYPLRSLYFGACMKKRHTNCTNKEYKREQG